MISVIVPTYNEENMLSKTAANLQRLSCDTELIFVDGGSTDRSVDIARQHGKVFRGKKGRAIQMNYGANRAKGDILLFLHADNIISDDAFESI